MEVTDILWSQKQETSLYLLALWNSLESHKTGCFNRYKLVAVFQASLLNENDILAIIVGKIEKKVCDIWSKMFFYNILSTLASDRYWLFRFIRNS